MNNQAVFFFNTFNSINQFLGPRTIWFIGSSIVHWTNKKATSRPGGHYLGLQHKGCRIVWLGQKGMRWGEFYSVVNERLNLHPLPSFIVIQLGSNDIGLMTVNKLFSDIECDLLRLHTLYPDIKFIWSEILMRCYWHTVLDG